MRRRGRPPGRPEGKRLAEDDCQGADDIRPLRRARENNPIIRIHDSLLTKERSGSRDPGGIFMDTAKPAQRFHYAWVVLVISFLMVGCALGFCSSTGGLYLAAITENMGIPRSLYSIANSCRYITTAIINLFFGKLIVKLGARKLAAMGFGCLAASTLVNSLSQNVVTFYLGGVLVGLGLAWTTTTLVGYVVERWFTSKKGTLMGVILAANGVFGALATQILSPIIYGSAEGWRTSYRVVSILMVCIGVLVVLFLRNDPKDLKLEPLGSGTVAKKKQKSHDWLGISVEEAFHRPYFYVAAVCVFLTGMLLQSVTSVGAAHMRDRGLDADTVAMALSFNAVLLTVSKLFTGYSFDKFGLRATMLFCNVCAVSGILIMAYTSNGTMALAAEFLCAFALPLETIMLPLIATELFGHKSYAFLMGLMVSFNTTGYAVGNPLMNLAYDLTGSYTNIMVVMCGIMVAVSVVMQFVITAAHKERARVEAGM